METRDWSQQPGGKEHQESPKAARGKEVGGKTAEQKGKAETSSHIRTKEATTADTTDPENKLKIHNR